MYSTEEIKSLLAEYFRTVGEITELEDARVGIDGLVIPYMDLDSAFSLLRDTHKRVLAKKYHDEESLTRTEQSAHSRAIRLLTCYVNEGGLRKVFEGLTGEGPRVGNRAVSQKANEVDAVVELQSLMEAMH
ncbi:hypothetical protein AN220_00565 [Streptomyces nanshensis]|nr:hypothetical protein AN220_00565 [Streptomyces nanshensis]